MDFRLYAKVLSRFRLIVGAGFLLALVLATFSVVTVSSAGLTYRQTQLWSSTTRLGVTQNGFPWGRLFAQEPSASGTLTPIEQANRLGIPIADPNRFKDLAILYAELATSDPVHRLMLRDGPVDGRIIANPVVVQDNVVLPLIDLTAISTSSTEAIALAERGAAALDRYLRRQQSANNVPETDRAVVQEILRPKDASVFQPRSKTMAIVIFLAVMFATVGLAFLLENLRPRAPELAEFADAGLQDVVRRTA
jgi:hypothetical protein